LLVLGAVVCPFLVGVSQRKGGNLWIKWLAKPNCKVETRFKRVVNLCCGIEEAGLWLESANCSEGNRNELSYQVVKNVDIHCDREGSSSQGLERASPFEGQPDWVTVVVF
jgi:hypothetical protein